MTLHVYRYSDLSRAGTLYLKGKDARLEPDDQALRKRFNSAVANGFEMLSGGSVTKNVATDRMEKFVLSEKNIGVFESWLGEYYFKVKEL